MNIRKLLLHEATAIIAELAEGKKHSNESLLASTHVLLDETMSYEHAMWVRDAVALSKEGFCGAAHLRAFIRASLPQGRFALTIRARNEIVRKYSRDDLVKLQIPAEEECLLCANGGRHAHPLWTQFRNNAPYEHDHYGAAAWIMAFDYAETHDENGNRLATSGETEEEVIDTGRANPW